MAKRILKNDVENGYKMSLEILGESSGFKGASVPDIFDQIKPGIIRGCAKVVINKGDLSAETILYPRQLRRLMVNKAFKLILAKKLESMLK